LINFGVLFVGAVSKAVVYPLPPRGYKSLVLKKSPLGDLGVYNLTGAFETALYFYVIIRYYI
jgi:hypothetical protein